MDDASLAAVLTSHQLHGIRLQNVWQWSDILSASLIHSPLWKSVIKIYFPVTRAMPPCDPFNDRVQWVCTLSFGNDS